jgi:alpha-tubulin suppressor-like RCC1 family protein
MKAGIPNVRRSVIISAAVLAAVVACGDDEVTETGRPVASVTITPDSAAITEGELAYFSVVLFLSISAGAYHTCGIDTAGHAYCWGQNNAGQLGNGRAGDSAAPVAVVGGLTFESISAGWLRTCGVTALGSLYCWGIEGSTPALISIAP